VKRFSLPGGGTFLQLQGVGEQNWLAGKVSNGQGRTASQFVPPISRKLILLTGGG